MTSWSPTVVEHQMFWPVATKSLHDFGVSVSQTPDRHTPFAPHELPHAPQWSTSDCKSRQPRLQKVFPLSHAQV